MEDESSFTVLENKTIGKNLSLYRKIRGLKATQLADHLGLKESSYTRYERGETAITIDFIQKASELLKVDPMMLISTPPAAVIDSGNNSPNSCISNHGYFNNQTVNEDQTKLMLKLIENVANLSEKLLVHLDKTK